MLTTRTRATSAILPALLSARRTYVRFRLSLTGFEFAVVPVPRPQSQEHNRAERSVHKPWSDPPVNIAEPRRASRQPVRTGPRHACNRDDGRDIGGTDDGPPRRRFLRRHEDHDYEPGWHAVDGRTFDAYHQVTVVGTGQRPPPRAPGHRPPLRVLTETGRTARRVVASLTLLGLTRDRNILRHTWGVSGRRIASRSTTHDSRWLATQGTTYRYGAS